jgi:hypothetical protein
MGYALPAAIGAKLAVPDRRVVALLGDGGFAMSGLELSTAKREGVHLTVIVFNDGHYGMIRKQQFGAHGQFGTAGIPTSGSPSGRRRVYAGSDAERPWRPSAAGVTSSSEAARSGAVACPAPLLVARRCAICQAVLSG